LGSVHLQKIACPRCGKLLVKASGISPGASFVIETVCRNCKQLVSARVTSVADIFRLEINVINRAGGRRHALERTIA